MTPEQFDAAVKDWLTWLRLDQWQINILPDAPNEDAILDIQVIEGRYLGQIRISDCFYDLEPRKQSMCICHELLHLKQQRLDNLLQYLVRNTSTDTKTAVGDIFHLEMEYMTDWLANVLADVFPIPESLIEKEEELNSGLTD